MSDDRTREPSRRRRDLARQQGQVARSPELTAAVGLLAALVLIGAQGGELASALIRLVREPFEADGLLSAWIAGEGPAALVAHLRATAWALAWPLVTILGGIVLAMLGAQLVQTGGLWAPGLLAPDPQRLWRGSGSGEELAGRLLRGLHGLLRALVVTSVAFWAIQSAWPLLASLSGLEAPGLAIASAGRLQSFAYLMGLALLALGLIDFVGQYRRLEARLRMSPDQEREERKADDGDPELRARRLRLARARFQEPREALATSALALTGPSGLVVLLGGSPPPGRVTVRLVARGLVAATIRRQAPNHDLPLIDAPSLALWFAQAEARSRGQRPQVAPPLPRELAEELTAIWPEEQEGTSENLERIPQRP